MGGYPRAHDGIDQRAGDLRAKATLSGRFPDAVSAILDFFGFVDTVRGTPPDYIRPCSPPIFIAHGLIDTKISYHQSEELDRALQQAGVPHQLILVPGAGHGIPLTGAGELPRATDLRPPVLAFVRQYLGPAH